MSKKTKVDANAKEVKTIGIDLSNLDNTKDKKESKDLASRRSIR